MKPIINITIRQTKIHESNSLRGNKAMLSALTKATMISSILAATAMPALAAAGGRRGIPSEPIVWGFLGCCALIVIAQILTMTGSKNKQSMAADEQTKSVKQHL